MLNQSRLLKYIKYNIAFPFQFIEYSDEQILEYVTTFTLREYSHYFPDTVTIPYNFNLASNKVPDKANEYYIQDAQGLEILNIANIYFTSANLLMFGHPPMGPMSYGDIANWALNVEQATMTKLFSNWDYAFEFKQPNTFRVSPTPTDGYVAVEYERIHPPDLSKIDNDLQMYFCEFCLADIMILLGRLRKKYEGNLKTPFGDIPISAEIGDEGKEKKAALIEKFIGGSIPNVNVDFT